jgi:hypothetical protein
MAVIMGPSGALAGATIFVGLAKETRTSDLRVIDHKVVPVHAAHQVNDLVVKQALYCGNLALLLQFGYVKSWDIREMLA